MIIVDTNVVSEFMRDEPGAPVVAWAEAVTRDALALTAISVEEVEHGLLRLPEGRRRQELERRWLSVISAFQDLVIPYDFEAARVTARLRASAQAVGRPVPLADAQIAGICVSRHAVLATRNVKDFAYFPELGVINPFDHQG